jgi:uncharacterized damage-inducible protein DinB
MKETQRIINQFEYLYNGEPWIAVNILDTLENISAQQAANKIAADHNSIWEITNHMISWRLNVLQRVKGKTMVSPGNNYFEPVTDQSEAAWKNTLEQMKISQQEWIDFLKTFSEDDFEKIYPKNAMTYYENIHGIIQHDAYHLGQITLLSKLI